MRLPPRRYPDQLLTVEVCLTRNETDNAPVAVDCPERRNWKLADGVQCGDSVAIMKGIVPPTCQTPKSPCNSVPSLPSGACVCPRLACPCAASDAAAVWPAERAAERAAVLSLCVSTPSTSLPFITCAPADCSKVEVIESEYAVADFKVSS